MELKNTVLAVLIYEMRFSSRSWKYLHNCLILHIGVRLLLIEPLAKLKHL